MIEFSLNGRCDTGRDDPALMIADRVNNEQNSTFGTADGLKSTFVLMAGVAPFDHRPFDYEARKTEIKPSAGEILVAFGAIPYNAVIASRLGKSGGSMLPSAQRRLAFMPDRACPTASRSGGPFGAIGRGRR